MERGRDTGIIRPGRGEGVEGRWRRRGERERERERERE